MPTRIGVEEEFILLDAETLLPAPRITQIIADARRLAGNYAQPELHRAQIESASEPSESLSEIGEQLAEQRARLAEAAARHGAVVLASATYPGFMGHSGQMITPEDRYEEMREANALIAEEQLICGCHVHVSVEGDSERIAVLNRIRRWLPHVLALSTNSPFWEDRDSGYASFRTEVWSRWPSAGPPGSFDSPAHYWSLLDTLVESGVILDRAMAYWDVRLSEQYPTVEIRVADVGLTVRDAMAIAGLARALVVYALSTPDPVAPLRHELLRAATWQAAKSGVGARLMDPLDGSTLAAPEAFARLLDEMGGSLEQAGEADLVRQLVDEILEHGTGADRQRAAFASRGDKRDVISLATV
jgi:glutamate---cysteine ligase / carboxylate-amine ligase